jgi:hypothetical protein
LKVPVPPCVARPGGLLSTSAASVRVSSMASAWASWSAVSSRFGLWAWADRRREDADDLAAASRSSGFARLPSTRT